MFLGKDNPLKHNPPIREKRGAAPPRGLVLSPPPSRARLLPPPHLSFIVPKPNKFSLMDLPGPVF